MKPLNIYLEAKLFEDEVESILKRLCSDEEEIIRDPRFYQTMFDFFLPNGCKLKEWPKNTAIEVKTGLRPSIISHLYHINCDLFEKGEISQLILVCKSSKIDGYLNSYLKTLKKQFITIIDLETLKQKSDKANVTHKTSKPVVKATPIDLAKNAFHSNRYTFFLGAGLSMDAKLPSWYKLLESLLKRDNNKPFKHINEANSESISSSMGYSNIITGRYALDGFLNNNNDDVDNNLEIIDRIRKALYVRKTYNSPLIKAVARAIKRKHPAQIITYNYDDLLDNLLDKKKFCSVSDNLISRSNKTPIYHVHGIITRNNENTSHPILSEKDYHKLYSNSHNWANVVQLNALYTSSCFFIGFSMTDPNQRRLLELAREQDIKSDENDKLPHFVFLKKEGLKGEAADNVNKEHWEEIEYMMSDFGLNVIWFDEFSDLPNIIDKISKR